MVFGLGFESYCWRGITLKRSKLRPRGFTCGQRELNTALPLKWCGNKAMAHLCFEQTYLSLNPRRSRAARYVLMAKTPHFGGSLLLRSPNVRSISDSTTALQRTVRHGSGASLRDEEKVAALSSHGSTEQHSSSNLKCFPVSGVTGKFAVYPISCWVSRTAIVRT